MKQAFDDRAEDKAPTGEGARKIETRFNGDMIEWRI